jgi:hypothetical protein
MFATVISLSQPGRGSNSLLFKLTGISHLRALLVSILVLLAPLGIPIIKHTINLVINKNLDPQSTLPRKDVYKLPIVALNFLAFTILSYLIFKRFESSLFAGVDGDYMVSLFYSQRIWNNQTLELGANFLQGLGGNISFPLNTLIDPGYVIGGISESLNTTISHCVWALLLFGSSFLLCLAINLPVIVSLLSAWLTPVLILFPIESRFYAVTSLIPHISTTIAVSSLLLALIIVESERRIWQVLRVALFILLSFFLLSTNPNNLILVSPIILIFAIAKILSIKSYKLKLFEAIIFAVVIFVLVASGSISFFIGLVLNSASVVFKDEFFIDRGSLVFASTLFTGIGCFLVPIAILGLLSLIFNRYSSPIQRFIGAGSIVYFILILLAGLANWRAPYLWKLPSPIYFEFFLWPVYCIGISYFISSLVYVTYDYLEGHILIKFPKLSASRSFFVSFPALALVAFISSYLLRSQKNREWKFPPPNSDMMNKIKLDLSYTPNSKFKGRLATFTGRNISSSVSWNDLQTYDYRLLQVLSNDMRKAGFWVNSIPTLTEYSPHITPRYYFFATRLLGKPGDKQIRNMMTLRNPDLRILEGLGISHIITDLKLPSSSENHVTLTSVEALPNHSIFLYKTSKANISGFSPVKVYRFATISDLVTRLNSSSFNFHEMIAVEESLGYVPKLFSVTESNINVERGSYRVKATSRGNSILVLPIEYSTCFEIVDNTYSGSPIKIFPGNALLTSIMFEKSLDLTLRYVNSPFHNQDCRYHDYKLFKLRLGKI